MARFIYVVDRSRPDLVERLSADFAAQGDVIVVCDRRRGERRLDTQGVQPERRRSDRRRQPELDQELRIEGMFITASSDLVMIVIS